MLTQCAQLQAITQVKQHRRRSRSVAYLYTLCWVIVGLANQNVERAVILQTAGTPSVKQSTVSVPAFSQFLSNVLLQIRYTSARMTLAVVNFLTDPEWPTFEKNSLIQAKL